MAHVIRPDAGESRLDALQRHGFPYFLNETNGTNGLVADRTQPGAPESYSAWTSSYQWKDVYGHESEGTALGTADDVAALLPQVRIEEVS